MGGCQTQGGIDIGFSKEDLSLTKRYSLGAYEISNENKNENEDEKERGGG